MNVFKLLTSRIGALSISMGKTAGMALTVGLVGMNVYNYMNETPAAQESRIRSFSEILSAGGTLPNDTGIRFDTGGVQFATAEEVAAQQGTLFDGGEAAVQRLESFSIQGRALGSGESGLGMGANAAVELGPDGRPISGVSVPDGSAVGAAVGQAAAAGQTGGTKINKLGEEREGGLKRASMARATGSNLGSGSSGSFGTSSSRSAQSASAKGGASARGTVGAGSEGYTLTGSMPGGSTLLAGKSNIRGVASNSSFMPGGRDSSIGSGTKSREGQSLRDIAVASSQIAANQHRSVNEGARPFMASDQLSGGVQVEGDGSSLTTGSGSTEVGDFEDAMNRRQGAFDQAVEETQKSEQERKQHRDRLAKNLIMLAVATVAACFAINYLMRTANGPWSYIAAAALGATMIGLIGFYFADCVKYIKAYRHVETGWAGAGIGVSILMAAAIGISYVKFSSNEQTKLGAAVSKVTGMKEALVGMGTTAVTSGAQTAFSSVKAVSNPESVSDGSLDSGTDDAKK